MALTRQAQIFKSLEIPEPPRFLTLKASSRSAT